MSNRQLSKGRQAAIAAFISLLIVGSAVGLAIASGDGKGQSPTTVAGQAPDTVGYVNYETPELLLEGHAGRPLVINFFASWCAPCRAELPDLAEAHARYGDRRCCLPQAPRPWRFEPIPRDFDRRWRRAVSGFRHKQITNLIEDVGNEHTRQTMDAIIGGR